MNTEVKKTMIGGFVVTALILCTIAVFVFGSGDFFKKTNSYVLFFEDSIKGLSKGAPVSLSGVEVGFVKEIRLVADIDKMTTYVPVIIEVNPSSWTTVGTYDFKTEKEKIENLVRKGLRAKLELQSVVTGKYMISIDFYPDEPILYKQIMPDMLEIPTIRGKLNKMADSLGKLPFDELFSAILSAVESIDRIVSSQQTTELFSGLNKAIDKLDTLLNDVDRMLPVYEALASNTDQEVARLGRQLEETVAEYKTLAKTMTAEIRPISADLHEVATNISQGVKNAQTLIETADEALDKDSPIMTELTQALKEMSLAARSIRVWADYLERHPEAFIRGKGEYRR
jgi:paraquat-inducible protein B